MDLPMLRKKLFTTSQSLSDYRTISFYCIVIEVTVQSRDSKGIFRIFRVLLSELQISYKEWL